MNDVGSMVWVELRKAIRSRMPLWTALGSLFLPLGIAFLIFVARNPQVAEKLGLVSAKAEIVAYAATDWLAYLRLYGEIVGAGGMVLSVLIVSWIFGREFADRTLKDLLAVPVRRGSIVLAKYIVAAIWAAAVNAVIYLAGLLMGVLLDLPGYSTGILLQGSTQVLLVALLAITAGLPFALFASMGRGYLLPIGVMILVMMMMNLAQVLGWGEFFPWAVPVLHAMEESPLRLVSYIILFLTGLAGAVGTIFWWKYADQNR